MLLKVYNEKPIFKAIFNLEMLKNLSTYKHGETHLFRIDLLINDIETLDEMHTTTQFVIEQLTGQDIKTMDYNACIYEIDNSLVITYEVVETRQVTDQPEYSTAIGLMNYNGTSDDYLISAIAFIQLYKHYQSTRTTPPMLNDKFFTKLEKKESEHALVNMDNISNVKREDPVSIEDVVNKGIFGSQMGLTNDVGVAQLREYLRAYQITEFSDIEEAYVLLPIIKEDVEEVSLYKSNSTNQFYLRIKPKEQAPLLSDLGIRSIGELPDHAKLITADAYNLFM